MADSNITKQALAAAFKELMKEKSFSRISIADITERCGMNRKSFYYHFRDKYDLANWIFDREFDAFIREGDRNGSAGLLELLCVYLYDNRSFYRKLLKVEGQNSFRDHFHKLLYQLIQYRLMGRVTIDHVGDFQIDFFSDAAVMAFCRWLLEPDCIDPDEFMESLIICIQCIADQLTDLKQGG